MTRRSGPWLGLYWGLLAIGFATVLWLNLPGQLTFDSVLQLYEGRNSHQLTFNPWIMSWMLGLSDSVAPGTGLFVIVNVAVLFASLAALPLLRGARAGLWTAVALTAMLLTPQVVNYQGIVWKDVLFANLAVAGFVALAFALRFPDRPLMRWGGLAKALVFLAVAGLVRQNGLIAAALAALALGIAESGRLGWRRASLFGLGGLAAVLALAFVLGAMIRPAQTDLKSNSVGLRVVRQYDIVGAVARDPKVDLGAIPTERAAVIRAQAPGLYSTVRIDTLDTSPTITRALWQTPKAALAGAWWGLILHRPGLYLSHRLAVFRQVFLTPDLALCLPVAIGVDGPPQYQDALGLKAGVSPRAERLGAWAAHFYGTPVFSHLAYAILALALVGVLATRRDGTDLAVIGLLLAGLGFAASFLLISIACDYRYLYMLDLSALVGLVYWAIDPPPLKRKVAS